MQKLRKLVNKNFLSSLDISKEELIYLLELAENLKNKNIEFDFKNKVLGLIFDKSSTRTRVSFQVAMSRLSGTTIDLNPTTSQIGRGEPIKDTARVLSSYCDVLAIRTYNQTDLEEYAKWSTIPVINALTDLEHPCQILADFLTIKEEFGEFKNIVLTYIGDGNNVANSLLLSGLLLGIKIRIACPKGYEPPSSIVEKAIILDPLKENFTITSNLEKALVGANVLYTDVWSSMGEEENSEKKDKFFEGFSINQSILDKTAGNAIVLHCLPAYRGKEITDQIIESSNSRVFEQAENRLYAQQSLLASMLTK
ncbi:ornithine carbamoyltransferase [Prochlorococcus sp. AH-716-G04]|nr:ornithine carbamoyltransferase [Prochlorococcus sp. AH-716-G04]